MSKVALLEAVAAAWNDGGIAYAVAHGIDEYPAAVGRDLDVLIDRQSVARAMAAARRILAERGLRVGRPPRVWGERLIAALAGETPDMIEIHAVTSLDWCGVRLAGAPRPSRREGPFAVDPWVSFVKRVLLPVLSGSGARLRDDPSRLPLREGEREAAARTLPGLVGDPLADALLGHLSRRNLDGVAAVAPALRRALLARGYTRHPLIAGWLLVRALRRKTTQPFSLCAPMVAMAGGAPAERSALAREIAHGDLLIFTRCVMRSGTGPAPGPAGGRRLGGLLSALPERLIHDRYASMRQQLVLYDDWPADATEGRVHAPPFPWSLLPRPDLLIVLDSGDPAPAVPSGARDNGTAASPQRPAIVRLPAALPADERRRAALAGIVRAFVEKNRPASMGERA